jgi:hypothetical protein
MSPIDNMSIFFTMDFRERMLMILNLLKTCCCEVGTVFAIGLAKRE